MSLIVPLAVSCLSGAGVSLPTGEPLIPAHELAGAMLVGERGMQRVEELHAELHSVASMRWERVHRACTAMLSDGRLALLVTGEPGLPGLEVLALPAAARRSDVLTEVGVLFTSVLGEMLAREARHRDVEVAEGDLSWLHPRFDPASQAYFRRA